MISLYLLQFFDAWFRAFRMSCLLLIHLINHARILLSNVKTWQASCIHQIYSIVNKSCKYAMYLSVRNVVPTLTSKSAEIHLSMAGAKQLVTRGLSWFWPGLYVQQWCARGIVLRCTVLLAEGSYKRGGRGGRASRSLSCDWGRVPISWWRQWACKRARRRRPRGKGTTSSFYRPRGGSLQVCRTVLITCSDMVHSVVE
jgi:hypothetical protein